jgi:hypothetical protein
MATIDDETNQIKSRERLAKEIAKTSDAIRQKYLALKTGKMEEDIALEKHFKPIVEPLKRIADATKSDDQPMSYEFGNEVMQPETKKQKICDIKMQNKSSKPKNHSHISINRSLVTSTPIKKQLKDTTNTPLLTNTSPDNFQLMQQHDSPPIVASQQHKYDSSPIVAPITDNDVFENTSDSLATKIKRQLQTSEGVKSLRTHFGPLGEKYMGAVLSGDGQITLDNVYGVYFLHTGTKLGNKSFDVDIEDNIIIDGVKYVGTPGLYELIFKKYPDEEVYTENDKQKYKSILLATNAHKRQHSALKPIISSKGYKYKHIISPLIRGTLCDGRGLNASRNMILNDNRIDYVHWNDPNELVDRLRLLEASRQAGNNAHDNEILSIIEELREAGLIIN